MITASARALLALFVSVLFELVVVQTAAAQAPARIWNVPLGSPVAELPAEFVMQACGSNGGPPTVPLDGFAEFARCPIEAATGLREIWFSYDDIAEYFLRAQRVSDEVADGARANTLFEQLVIYSVLVDAQGRVQGYRIISNPRESTRRRIDADAIGQPLKNVVFGAFGWTCTDLPKIEGERPFKGQFVKELCKKESNGRSISVETHVMLKPGQMTYRPGEGLQPNEFDVQVRVEVINAALQLPAAK